MKEPIALLVADLHLSLHRPACRADEDWMATQAEYLRQLDVMRGELDLPILCAGDLFDHWRTPPELINFALKHLPDGMICVPGQHDLPYHSLEDMDRCGYGVLSRVDKIRDLSGKTTGNMGDWQVNGFAWGQEIKPPVKDLDMLRVALVHRYVWTVGNSYPGAQEQDHLKTLLPSLKGYHVAVFGDNHKGFLKELKTGTTVYNCGTFIRRKSDELDYEPSVGFLYLDGSIEQRPLNMKADRFFEDAKQREEVPFNMRDFLEGLEGLGEHGLNFREAVENHLRTEDLDPRIKEIILRALEPQ